MPELDLGALFQECQSITSSTSTPSTEVELRLVSAKKRPSVSFALVNSPELELDLLFLDDIQESRSTRVKDMLQCHSKQRKRGVGHRGHRPAHAIHPVMGPEYDIEDRKQSMEPLGDLQDSRPILALGRTSSPELSLRILLSENRGLQTRELKEVDPRELSPDMNLGDLFHEELNSGRVIGSRGRKSRSQSAILDGEGWMTQPFKPSDIGAEDVALNELDQSAPVKEQLLSPFYAWKYSTASSTRNSKQVHLENKKRGCSNGHHAIAVPAHRHMNSKGHLHQRSEPWDHHNHHRYQRGGENCNGTDHNEPTRQYAIQPSSLHGRDASSDFLQSDDNQASRSTSSDVLTQDSHIGRRRSFGHRGHRPARLIQPIMGPEYDIKGRKQSEGPQASHQDTMFIQAQDRASSPELNLENLFSEDCGPVAKRPKQVRYRETSPDMNLGELFWEESPSFTSISRSRRLRSRQATLYGDGWMTQSSKRNSRRETGYDGSAMRVVAPASSTFASDSTTFDHDEQKHAEPNPDTGKAAPSKLDRTVRGKEQLPSPFYAWKNSSASSKRNSEQIHLENKKRGYPNGHHAIAVPARRRINAKSHLHQRSEPWDHHNHHRHQCNDESCDSTPPEQEPDFHLGNIQAPNTEDKGVLQGRIKDRKRSVGHRGHRPAHSIQPVMGPEYGIEGPRRSVDSHVDLQDARFIQAPDRASSPELNFGILFSEGSGPLTKSPKQVHYRESSPDMNLGELFREEVSSLSASTPRVRRLRSQSMVVDDQGWMTQSPKRKSHEIEYYGPAIRVIAPVSSTLIPNSVIDIGEQEPVESNIDTEDATLNELDQATCAKEQIPSPFYAWKSSSTATKKSPTQAHIENKRREYSNGHHAIPVPAHRRIKFKGHLCQSSEPWDHHNHHRHRFHDENYDDATHTECTHHDTIQSSSLHDIEGAFELDIDCLFSFHQSVESQQGDDADNRILSYPQWHHSQSADSSAQSNEDLAATPELGFELLSQEDQEPQSITSNVSTPSSYVEFYPLSALAHLNDLSDYETSPELNLGSFFREDSQTPGSSTLSAFSEQRDFEEQLPEEEWHSVDHHEHGPARTPSTESLYEIQSTHEAHNCTTSPEMSIGLEALFSEEGLGGLDQTNISEASIDITADSIDPIPEHQSHHDRQTAQPCIQLKSPVLNLGTMYLEEPHNKSDTEEIRSKPTINCPFAPNGVGDRGISGFIQLYAGALIARQLRGDNHFNCSASESPAERYSLHSREPDIDEYQTTNLEYQRGLRAGHVNHSRQSFDPDGSNHSTAEYSTHSTPKSEYQELKEQLTAVGRAPRCQAEALDADAEYTRPQADVVKSQSRSQPRSRLQQAGRQLSKANTPQKKMTWFGVELPVKSKSKKPNPLAPSFNFKEIKKAALESLRNRRGAESSAKSLKKPAHVTSSHSTPLHGASPRPSSTRAISSCATPNQVIKNLESPISQQSNQENRKEMPQTAQRSHQPHRKPHEQQVPLILGPSSAVSINAASLKAHSYGSPKPVHVRTSDSTQARANSYISASKIQPEHNDHIHHALPPESLDLPARVADKENARKVTNRKGDSAHVMVKNQYPPTLKEDITPGTTASQSSSFVTENAKSEGKGVVDSTEEVPILTTRPPRDRQDHMDMTVAVTSGNQANEPCSLSSRLFKKPATVEGSSYLRTTAPDKDNQTHRHIQTNISTDAGASPVYLTGVKRPQHPTSQSATTDSGVERHALHSISAALFKTKVDSEPHNGSDVGHIQGEETSRSEPGLNEDNANRPTCALAPKYKEHSYNHSKAVGLKKPLPNLMVYPEEDAGYPRDDAPPSQENPDYPQKAYRNSHYGLHPTISDIAIMNKVASGIKGVLSMLGGLMSTPSAQEQNSESSTQIDAVGSQGPGSAFASPLVTWPGRFPRHRNNTHSNELHTCDRETNTSNEPSIPAGTTLNLGEHHRRHFKFGSMFKDDKPSTVGESSTTLSQSMKMTKVYEIIDRKWDSISVLPLGSEDIHDCHHTPNISHQHIGPAL
ncbi:hypothetical protein BGX26_007517 [Mortierella sp. AD094]|nr:hypothetical protein BGX26_007517 [Mortierella sp. AD094]